MTLAVLISPQVEARLRQQAAAEGQDPGTYAAKLLEHAVRRTTLDELLAPLRSQFAATGTTDEELVQQITDARSAYRSQSRLERA
jgi:hypothetical protein